MTLAVILSHLELFPPPQETKQSHNLVDQHHNSTESNQQEHKEYKAESRQRELRAAGVSTNCHPVEKKMVNYLQWVA